jgi:hypothetical protein
MPLSKKRKPSFLGTRVLVCGKTVSGKNNLICLLPPNLIHTVHSSLAIGSDGFLILVHREEGKEPIWQQPLGHGETGQVE